MLLKVCKQANKNALSKKAGASRAYRYAHWIVRCYEDKVKMNKLPYAYRKWLQKPLVKIKFSAGFIKAVTMHRFKTLEQVIYYPLRELVKTSWFTGSFLHEISEKVDQFWKNRKKKKESKPKKQPPGAD